MSTKITENINRRIVLSNGLELYMNYYEYYNSSDPEAAQNWKVGTSVELIEKIDLFWPYKLVNKLNNKIANGRKFYDCDLIPDGKHDFEAIERLKKAQLEEMKPILPYLFEWTDDFNDPIASELSKVLTRLGENIIPYVIYYFRKGYGMGVYYEIIPNLEIKLLEMLREEFEEVMRNPSNIYADFDNDVVAFKYLVKLNIT